MRKDSPRNRFQRCRISALALVLTFALAAFAASAQDDEGYAGISPERSQLAAESFNSLKVHYPAVQAYKMGPLVTRLYATVFGRGSSPTIV
ncbi:MAG: hypothetical protein ACE5K8_07275, partial [Candidatus Zixiibacteriota bacterium]